MAGGRPYVVVAAIAAATSRVRVGVLVSALARRRPWKLARETASLDVLSGGRLVVGAGLGSQPHEEFAAFGEDPAPRVRAEKLDEGLAILVGLWSGEAFSHHGRHYTVDETVFRPRPLQRPRIPIWIAGRWPARPPFRRAARWDSVFATFDGVGHAQTPDPAQPGVSEEKCITPVLWSSVTVVDPSLTVCLKSMITYPWNDFTFPNDGQAAATGAPSSTVASVLTMNTDLAAQRGSGPGTQQPRLNHRQPIRYTVPLSLTRPMFSRRWQAVYRAGPMNGGRSAVSNHAATGRVRPKRSKRAASGAERGLATGQLRRLGANGSPLAVAERPISVR